MEYVHNTLNEAVESIGGYYFVDKEAMISHDGRKVLVEFGCAIVDNSCCGIGGFRYADVVGYVNSWRTRLNKEGSPVSEVEPVRGEEARREIRQRLKEVEPYCQVNFFSG
jgi:hypothetical protein